MPYLDIHVRTPDRGDIVARSVMVAETEDLGGDVREMVFGSIPEATDYTFREISRKEVKERAMRAYTYRLAKMAIQYTTMQTNFDNKTKGF